MSKDIYNEYLKIEVQFSPLLVCIILVESNMKGFFELWRVYDVSYT